MVIACGQQLPWQPLPWPDIACVPVAMEGGRLRTDQGSRDSVSGWVGHGHGRMDTCNFSCVLSQLLRQVRLHWYGVHLPCP